MVKYGRDEDIQGNPQDLLMYPLFSSLVHLIPYGVIGFQPKVGIGVLCSL